MHFEGGISIILDTEKSRKVLLDNGFVVWKWGQNEQNNKLEGHLAADICEKLIGIKEKCFVAALLDINEARFIIEDKFNEKVQGHEKQFKIERIIFGKDKDKIYKDGKLILFETIVPLEKVVKFLKSR
ncbi:MAG: hypothetical protein ACOC4G_07650 [Bacillota bacterium]